MVSVGLVSCVKKKRNHASAAKDLYISPLFTKARKYIERRCSKWYILSAKYGLVHPDKVIEPYEETLKIKSRSERTQWTHKVWEQLQPHLNSNDKVVILAGNSYREFLFTIIREYGCGVEVPMEGKSFGKQLQWLSQQFKQSYRERELDRFYSSLRRLENGLGGKRLLSALNGQHNWPKKGVYLFFEPEEYRSAKNELRVVRVGTHGVSRGSKATLWNRLRTHRGTGDGLGNHRSSIFRLHLGAALLGKNRDLVVPSWGVGQDADKKVRKHEERLEREVSKIIGTMSVLWLSVEDEAGPANDRAYLERNMIGLLVGPEGPIDQPSAYWLGRFSSNERIRKSGLWNLEFLDYSYSSEFLDVLDEYVSITVGEKAKPQASIAPHDWYLNDRKGLLRNQLSLFEDQQL